MSFFGNRCFKTIDCVRQFVMLNYAACAEVFADAGLASSITIFPG
ncbi:hypothetical protein [Paraburkholderia sp. SIMBA_030]